jgi:hypothetical protein
VKDKVKTRIIIFKESTAQSIARDIVSAAVLLGSVWFNQTYIGGSYLVNTIILVLLMMLMAKLVASEKKEFYSGEDAIAFIRKEFEIGEDK